MLNGYPRADGRVGFRNHLLVVPLTGCLSTLAWRIADRAPGATALIHPHGCDLFGNDYDLFTRQMEGLMLHPNVGGVLFLTMGCAATNAAKLPEHIRESGRLVAEINTHKVGGSTHTVARGCELAVPMVEQLSSVSRVDVPLSSLIVGTKCGSSNPESFSHCHPVLGAACDQLVDAGGTVVLSEDCELYAAADLLAKRAATPDVAGDILAMATQLQRYWTDRFNTYLNPDDPAALAKTRQRSLEHAAKAGNRPFQRVIDMAERIQGPGLVILNGPNTDLESTTCLAASGCQLIAFTTGRGTVVGSPVAITVKMTATRETVERMRENIDLDVSAYTTGEESLADAAARTFRHLIDAANGAPQAAETLGHWEIAFPVRGVTF